MATFTTTVTEAIAEEAYKPNVRPDGPEKSPDHRWRAWRLRQQRSDIRELLLPSFPNLNRQLREQDLDKIRQYSSRESPPGASVLFEPRKLEELKAHNPVRLEFRPLRDVFLEIDREQQRLRPRKTYREDEEDSLPYTWLTEMTQGLFARVWDFCADTFGRECFGGRVDERDWTDFILRKLPTDFISSASSVVRGDPVRHPKPNDPHSYEHLFLAKNERIFLMVGTISKLLELNVFDSLLFGALEDEAKTLKLQDKTTAHTEDGYQRNLARVNLIRQYLTSGRDLEPDLFWEEVDRVTLGILDLLLPMINFLGFISPLTAWPKLTEVHQSLHNIVAEAAKLTNGLRVCRSVCWIDYPLTGDLWGLNHEHTTDSIYNESAQRASVLDARVFNETTEMRDWVTRRADAAEVARRRWPDRSEAWVRQWEIENPKPFDRSRRAAKVQIILWPSFTTHFPVKQNTATGGGINVGEERHTIIKAQVVYYSGKSSDEGDHAENLTLQQHIQRHRGLVNNGRSSRLGQLGHCRPSVFTLLTGLFIVLILFWLFSRTSISLERLGSQANIEVIEEHEFAGKPIFTVTTTAAAGAEVTEHPDMVLSLSPLTPTSHFGFLNRYFGGKKQSDSGSVASITVTTPLPVDIEPEVVFTASVDVPKTAIVKGKSASKSASKPSQSSESSSAKSTMKVTVTETEWTQIGQDGAKRIMSVSPLDSTAKTANSVDIESSKPIMSTKPKPVTKEDDVRHPVSVTKPDFVESSASVSSPSSLPVVASSDAGSWNWLRYLDPRRLLDDSNESDYDHLTTRPATQSAITTIAEKKTIVEPRGSSSSKSTVSSKADELTSLDKVPTVQDLQVPSASSSVAVSSSGIVLSPVPTDESPLVENHSAQTTTSGPSTSGQEPVIQIIGPSQMTMTGRPAAVSGGDGGSGTGDVDSSSSPPTTSSNDDGWELEYASIVTHVSKWTNTRVKTYTEENGQVVTVSEEVPRSKESVSSVAPWHRRLVPL